MASRTRILAVSLAALLALSAGAASVPAADGKTTKAKRSTAGGAARTAIGVARAVRARPNPCSSGANASRHRIRRLMSSMPRRNPAQRRRARGKRRRLVRRERRRLARLARNCALREATGSTAPPQPTYWGAAIGDHVTGTQAPWDMNAVASFESAVGKPLSLIHFFAPFANCYSSCWHYDFPTDPMESIREHGAIPFFSFSSQSIPSNLSQPDFQLSDVIEGDHDDYLREFATDAADWGHPFFLRFNWEMNGDWFSWSEGVNGNGAGEYVAAWRHVHEVFEQAGASNATWVWCPNVDPEGKFQSLASLYPGDAYVDWTCLDGYNWGTQPGAQASRLSVEQLFGSTYREVTGSIAPAKPMVIGETGASERSGAKGAWISELLERIPTDYPQLRGLVWFDKYDDGMDWPIETSGDATAAFAAGIQAPAYKGNQYGGIEASPIPPPS